MKKNLQEWKKVLRSIFVFSGVTSFELFFELMRYGGILIAIGFAIPLATGAFLGLEGIDTNTETNEDLLFGALFIFVLGLSFALASDLILRFFRGERRTGMVGMATGIFGIPFFFAVLYLFMPQPCVSQGTLIRGEFLNSLYFSYTTYTTLGYGDMTPVGWCRLVAMVEAVTGYIFMAFAAAIFFKFLSDGERNKSKDISDTK